jgi:hypothetical protein
VVIAMCIGIALGACARELAHGVATSSAYAQQAPRKAYKVLDPSRGSSGYEEDLNRYTASGWRFAFTLHSERDTGDLLVFESP